MKLECREDIGRFKYTENEKMQAEYDRIMKNLDDEIRAVLDQHQE